MLQRSAIRAPGSSARARPSALLRGTASRSPLLRVRAGPQQHELYSISPLSRQTRFVEEEAAVGDGAAERLPHQLSVGQEASTSDAVPQQKQPWSWPAVDLSWLTPSKSVVLAGGLLASLGVDDKPGSVVAAMGVLAAIVAVHEAGHFAAARLQGIRVAKFAIGFGPTLWKYKGPEVEYCLNAIPLGGYVAFPDDDPAALEGGDKDKAGKGKAKEGAKPAAAVGAAAAGAAEAGAEGALKAEPGAAEGSAAKAEGEPERKFNADDPDLLKNRPIPQRALVISAGVIANMAFAWLVLLAQVSTVGKAESAFLPGVRVILPDTPAAAQSAAARGGLRSGDVLLRIGDVEVPAGPSQVGGGQDRVSSSVAAIRAAAGRELLLTVQRPAPPLRDAPSSSPASSLASTSAGQAPGGEVLALRVTPDAGADGSGRIGVQLSANTYIAHSFPADWGQTLEMTNGEFTRLSSTVWNGLRQIVTNFGSMAGQLSGPVAIVAAGSEVLRTDAAGLYQFAAIVNINLAAVNVLPLPALDGGYLALLAIEALRGGRKLPAALEQGVMASGFLLLTALGVGLVIRDTINLL
ncbi:hypothetical protein HYH03_006635 [Edaphochlamys debaryana]|uniref:Peptidase M50 domain-containing protein n=1 Tax=Edaphochlamys debaryana TaxID=47281 RepID=A0A835Y591_9CHLO|nr:hypothetical protein HYH03_006635 [Edaphochlamys debaryana]|eukprot:KAG2495367.1 hypothetical protein HYH03_006635 [Edaphochlamys debaryana]